MGKRGKLPSTSMKVEMPGPAMMAKPSKEDKERERKYKAEDAMRDLERAESHKKDKQLMSDVKGLAKEKMANLKKMC